MLKKELGALLNYGVLKLTTIQTDWCFKISKQREKGRIMNEHAYQKFLNKALARERYQLPIINDSHSS